jgi:hypothetical protein
MATQTTNYGLTKDAVTDYYNVNTTNANLDIIDATLGNSAKFEKAVGTATAVTLTGIVLEDGKVKNFIVSADNNGMDTKINGKPLYKPGTTTAPKLIAGKAITIWYDATGNCFFIKASAEGNASAEHVLAGDTFSTESDTGLVGTMPIAPNYPLNNSSVIFDVYDDKAYANGVHNSFMKVPKGYYNDTWIGMNMPTLNKDNLKAGVQIGSNNKITGIFTADATAVDANVLVGKTYYRNGVKGTGNIPVAGTFTQATDYHQYPNNSVDGAHNMFVQPPKGYYDGSVWVAVNEPDLIPSNVRAGVIIGQGTGFTGTLLEVKELYDFPLSIQTTQPTAVRTGHIWVNSVLGTSINTVKIVEAINAGEANGTLMLVVGTTEYRNFNTAHAKTITDGTTKSFSIADTNTTNDWLVQSITGGITSTTYLNKPMVYSKIGGVLDVETAYMWNGSSWVLLSQKGNYVILGTNYPTGSASIPVYNKTGDTFTNNISLSGGYRTLVSRDGSVVLTNLTVYIRNGDVFSSAFTIPNNRIISGFTANVSAASLSGDGRTIAVEYNYYNNYTYFVTVIYKLQGSTFVESLATSAITYNQNGTSSAESFQLNLDGSLLLRAYYGGSNYYPLVGYFFYSGTYSTTGVILASSAEITFSLDNNSVILAVFSSESSIRRYSINYENRTLSHSATLSSLSATRLSAHPHGYTFFHYMSAGNYYLKCVDSSGAEYGIKGNVFSSTYNNDSAYYAITFNLAGDRAIFYNSGNSSQARYISVAFDTSAKMVTLTYISNFSNMVQYAKPKFVPW